MSASTSKPIALAVILAHVPTALKVLDRWVVWRWTWKADEWDKPPFNARTGHLASSTNPATWSSFAAAAAAYQQGSWDGIGVVLTADDDLVGIDLDHCVNEDGGIHPGVLRDVLALNSYTERSPSGTGLRVVLRAKKPPGKCRSGHFEIYETGRYVTITGHRLDGATAVEYRQEQVEAFHAKRIATTSNIRTKSAAASNGSNQLSDAEVIDLARNARNAAVSTALYDGSDALHDGDTSRADLALCAHFAFWTGRDPEQLDRLFRGSGRMRAKWDDRRGDTTYGARTIAEAIARTTETYTPIPRVTVVGNGEGHGVVPLRAPAASGSHERHNTDLGNARRLIDRHGADLRYCTPRQRWLVWDGTRWRADATDKVVRLAKDTVGAIYAEAADEQDPSRRKAIARWATSSEARVRIDAMIALAASEPGVPVLPEQLDADPWALNCQNGTIDLRTGELRGHRRDDLITRTVPVHYDPDARLPLWDDFLRQATGGVAALAAFLGRLSGYTATGLTHEEVLAFLYGGTASGKSTFLEALNAALGDYAATADFETFLARREAGGPRQDIARLAGKRFVKSIEVDDGKKLAAGLVKNITGGENITARFLYGCEFEFLPTFKLWLAANDRPQVRGDDTALWRRILTIPFDHPVPPDKRDPAVKATLRNPAVAGQAVLAWIVRGCLDWQRRGLDVPASVTRATDAYRTSMDPLAEFIEDCCIVGEGRKVVSRQLHGAYAAWHRVLGEGDLLSQRALTEAFLRRPGIRADRVAGARGLHGVGLRDGAPT